MKTVLLLGGPAAGQRVETNGGNIAWYEGQPYAVVPMCSHGEVHWFGVLDGADPLALLIAGYVSPAPLVERMMGALPAFEAPYGTHVVSGAMAAHDRALKNDDRFRKLHSHLLGYVENGGGDHVSIAQDDATREFILTINAGRPSRRAYYSGSVEGAFDAAIAGEGDKS